MRTLKPWPHLTVIAIVFGLAGGIVAALWVKHQQTAEAKTLPTAARVERVEGDVSLNSDLTTGTNDEWTEVTQNTPLSVGDRIYTRDKSRAAIAFTGRNFARLNEGSALDVLSLSDGQTQLALRDGSALFDVGYLDQGDLFEVATPYGAVDFNQPGLYEVGINDNGSAWVSVLTGLAQVAGLAGSGEVSKGEMLTLLGQTAAEVALSRLNPNYAGALADDYYAYRYPDVYDGRYRDYNAYLDDPYYYDPYRRYSSYQYASDSIPGLYDLDSYGDWQSVNGYGQVWRPRVDEGWAPYQSGYWVNDYPHGLTWVSNEPWGYAPYHYGRWANADNQWFWVPERARTQPLYSPALVAFLPLTQDNGIGWVPLAPGDQYAYRYYNENWQPQYLTRTQVVPAQVVNLNVPGAVTIVPWQEFDQDIDRRKLRRGDRQTFTNVTPLLDPLREGAIRNVALRSGWGRRKTDLPRGIAKRLDDTRVVTDAAVVAPPFRRDLARRLRVEQISENAKRSRFRVRDERHFETGQRVENRKGIDNLLDRAARGEKQARRQMEQNEQQQRREQREKRQVEQTHGQRVSLRAQQQSQREAVHQQQVQQSEAQRHQRVEGQRVARQRAFAEREAREAARQSRRNQDRQSQPKSSRGQFLGPPVRVKEAQRPESRRDVRSQSEHQARRQADQQQQQPRPERQQRRAEPRQPALIRHAEKADRKQGTSAAPQQQSEEGRKGKGRP